MIYLWNYFPPLKKTSNTKLVASEPPKPAEGTVEAGVVDDSKDAQMNIPNGKVEKLKVHVKNAKRVKISDGKVLILGKYLIEIIDSWSSWNKFLLPGFQEHFLLLRLIFTRDF